MRVALAELLLFAAICDRSSAALKDDLQKILQNVADQMRDKYDMGLAASLYSPDLDLAVASGYTDAGLGIGKKNRMALPDDLYVWGSTTKMFTAPAVLQLVEKGLVTLTDSIVKHIDPILLHLNGTRLADHFGTAIEAVQIQHLLHMTSGIEDYDNDAYAKDQFAHRSMDIGPVEIIGKYVGKTLRHTPGESQSYCSANYVLLGFVLANHYHKNGTTWSWTSYDQKTVIPDALRKAFNHSKFALSGTCSDYTPVHGIMQSYSTASLPPQDVWNVSCLGGWTGGNYLGSVGDVARYTYDLYNTKRPLIVSETSQNLMTNFTAPHGSHGAFKFYGMGTFSLDWSIGSNETAYGHVGDTYGYQAQTTYFPDLDFVLSVATNVETTTQAQPADFTCVAYHAIKAAMQGTSSPSCSFTVFRQFIGTCSCTQDSLVV
jgi:CubicO group peptidase (beta-lactamase class C family)